MKSSFYLSCYLFLSSWNVLALNLSESNLINRLSVAVINYANVRTNLSCEVKELLHYQKAETVALSNVLAHAFSDEHFDQSDSFLSGVLQREDLPSSIVYAICRKRFTGKPLSNGERGRLCNFMIRSFYENRSRIPDYYQRINVVLFQNDYPEVYNQETKTIVKELILKRQLHFIYADVIHVTSEREVRDFLWQVVKESETRNSFNGFCLSWMATVMLAKTGDKVARKKVEDITEGLSDISKFWIVTRGMAYIGDRAMVLRLFKMLESDKKEWNGKDVIPKETQVAHDAATALSLCVKDFPAYDPLFPQDFLDEDKNKCIKWVEEHKETFVIANKQPLYYLRNAGFYRVWDR